MAVTRSGTFRAIKKARSFVLAQRFSSIALTPLMFMEIRPCGAPSSILVGVANLSSC